MGGGGGGFLANPVQSVGGVFNVGGAQGDSLKRFDQLNPLQGVMGGKNVEGVHFDQGVRPDRPQFQSLQDPNTPGRLQSGYVQSTGANINQNKDVLNQMRTQALAKPGESAWEKMATQKQGLEEASAREKAIGSAGQAQANANTNLAMRGGLSSGARERMGMDSQRNLQAQMQDVGAQGAKARADIGLQAQQQQQQLQQAMPGMELQSIQPDMLNREYASGIEKYNIENSIKEKQAKDLADMSAYTAQMKDWAGAGQANAMAAGNNRGKK